MKLNSKLIRCFVHKELKWNVDFYSLQDYLKRQGYTIIFYNTEYGDKIVDAYNLSCYADDVNAFTFRRKDVKFVFVNMNLSTADKLYVLLHEVAHIYLKHLDENPAVFDERLQEMEADTFAHQTLEYAKSHNILKSGIKLSIPAILLSVICLLGAFQSRPTAKAPIAPIESTSKAYTNYKTEATEATYVPDSETVCVYITPSGAKFHRPDCRYVKNKSCTAFLRTEAAKHYLPCLVCNP